MSQNYKQKITEHPTEKQYKKELYEILILIKISLYKRKIQAYST